MPSPQIDLTLVCSTSHYSLADDGLLREYARQQVNDSDTSPQFVIPTGYGYIVWVDSEGDFGDWRANTDLSNEFVAVLEFAHRQAVQWVRFDRDGTTLDGFPTFDW